MNDEYTGGEKRFASMDETYDNSKMQAKVHAKSLPKKGFKERAEEAKDGETKIKLNDQFENSFENGFLLSDGDDEVRKKTMKKMSRKRFGHVIKFDKYKTSNLIKIISIVLAIIVIPLEIFLESVIQ